MATAVVMPRLGLTMTAGAVALWSAEEGQPVTAGDIIVEIVTEKITYQVEAPVSGTLLKVVVEEGEEVPVGTTIGVIGEPGEDFSELLQRRPEGPLDAARTAAGQTRTDSSDAEPSALKASAQPKERIPASPAARKLAAEIGIELSAVKGTGPGGRITTEDVRTAAEAEAYGASPDPPASSAPARAVLREIPYLGVRRAIGEHMAHSQTVSPTVTHHTQADVQDLTDLLARRNQGRDEETTISFTAAVVKATAGAIAAEPSINASLDDDVIKLWKAIDIGVAVAAARGLVVPVVRSANTKTLDEISLDVRRLAREARTDTVTPDDVTGGTFTITNVGGYGSVDWFTPIINQPQAAILGVGRIVERVVARGGAPAVRSTVGLSLTFDHRIIDGAPAAAFLRILLDRLEEPEGLLA